MSRALLDVNVLIALLDAGHLHHSRAMKWLRENVAGGWASCPLTQNGAIRIMSNPSYPGAQPPAVVAGRLAEAAATEWHEFWPDGISLLENNLLRWERVLGSRQITDFYLLGLAVRHGGRFVTLDRKIDVFTVTNAEPGHLVILD